MRMPLRYQFLIPTIGVTISMIVGVSLLSAHLSARQAQERVVEQLSDVARTLSEPNFPLNAAVLSQMRGLSGAEYLHVDENGTPRAASRYDLVAPPDQWETVAWDKISLSHSVQIGGESYFHAAIVVPPRAANIHPTTLHMFYPQRIWQEARWNSIQPPLVVGAVALALTTLLTAVAAARATRPLEQLRREVDRIAQGDFRPMSLPARNDEIRDLAESVDRMAEMLADYEKEVRQGERKRTLQQMGAAIAHQMRNAVTGCRLALDLHCVDLHRVDLPESEGDESLAVASRQLELMERYLRGFLSLGRTEEAPRVEVDLVRLAREAMQLVAPSARHVNVDLRFESPDDSLPLRGDAQGLEQLLVNLLLNAIDAASRPSENENGSIHASSVELVLSRDGAQARLEVWDAGAGPAESVRDTLFEPLVTEKPQGAGLGLAIARQIAVAHDGAIHWRREQGRTCFSVEIPLTVIEEASHGASTYC